MLYRKVTFYVPSTKNVGTPLTPDEESKLVERVENFMEDAFGGFTSITGKGGWKRIRERVTLVTSYHDLETITALAVVIPLAEAIKQEYGQAVITIETESGLEWV